MRECEKHTEQLCMIPGRVDTVARKEDFSRGWKEALEEVLKQVDQSNSDGSIIVWIKEELGDT